MNMTRPLRLFSFSVACFALAACSPESELDSATADDALTPAKDAATGPNADDAGVASCCESLLAVDFINYSQGDPNVTRELRESLADVFVTPDGAVIPGVLHATGSPSQYDYAAQVEFAVWSSIETASASSGSSQGALYVQIGPPSEPDVARASKALFKAMTKATETTSNGVTIRRSSKGSVVCQLNPYTDIPTCVLGPFNRVSNSEACP